MPSFRCPESLVNAFRGIAEGRFEISQILGHVHTSPFSFRSAFTRKNAANFLPCSHYSVFR